jgi:REP element-mobilizing transposase RayT
MSDPQIPLESGNFYHIYNRGINGCDIFKEVTNYEYFLRLYNKHIDPIADTYAWVLMGNHFHLLVRINDPNLTDLKPPHQHFSNLFNAYSKAFNKFNNRHGALFERAFKRKLVDNMDYLKKLVIYIHNNPVHHGFCEHPIEYPWSSYLTCTSDKASKVKRDEVINWFGGEANFRAKHEGKSNRNEIEKWLDS